MTASSVLAALEDDDSWYASDPVPCCNRRALISVHFVAFELPSALLCQKTSGIFFFSSAFLIVTAWTSAKRIRIITLDTARWIQVASQQSTRDVEMELHHEPGMDKLQLLF